MASTRSVAPPCLGPDRAATAAWTQEYDLHWHVVDACCLLGLGGIFLAMTARGLRSAALIPEGDPRLGESLAFENY